MRGKLVNIFETIKVEDRVPVIEETIEPVKKPSSSPIVGIGDAIKESIVDSNSRLQNAKITAERKAAKDKKNPPTIVSSDKTKAKLASDEKDVRVSSKPASETRAKQGHTDEPAKVSITKSRGKGDPKNVAHRVKPAMDKEPRKFGKSTVTHKPSGDTTTVRAVVGSKKTTRGVKTGKGDPLKTVIKKTGGSVKIPRNFGRDPKPGVKKRIRVSLKDSYNYTDYGALKVTLGEMAKSAMSSKRGTKTGKQKDAESLTKKPLTPEEHAKIQAGKGEVQQSVDKSDTKVNLPDSKGIAKIQKKTEEGPKRKRKPRHSSVRKAMAKKDRESATKMAAQNKYRMDQQRKV